MPDKSEKRFEASPDSAAEARSFVRSAATLDSMRFTEADLLVTELIGNVIAHAPDVDHFVVEVDESAMQGVTIAVSHPADGPLDPATEGVGLMLVERMSRSWGHDFDDGSLRVWFTLRSPGTTAIPQDIDDDDLFERMDEDPAAYSDALARRHADLAASIARRYRGKGVDEDDLLQVANMALVKAIQRYDASLGTIRPYAAATISGELKRLLRDKGWSVRVPRSLQERSLEVAKTAEKLAQDLKRPPEAVEIADVLDITEEEVVEAMDARQAYVSNSIDKPAESTGVTISERLEEDDLRLLMTDDRLVVEEAAALLPERQQRILELRFKEDMTQSEIADEVGISQMHVSRLLSRALNTLKETIGDPGD
jgi:RNA polymerase sigma-B factor